MRVYLLEASAFEVKLGDACLIYRTRNTFRPFTDSYIMDADSISRQTNIRESEASRLIYFAFEPVKI